MRKKYFIRRKLFIGTLRTLKEKKKLTSLRKIEQLHKVRATELKTNNN